MSPCMCVCVCVREREREREKERETGRERKRVRMREREREKRERVRKPMKMQSNKQCIRKVGLGVDSTQADRQTHGQTYTIAKLSDKATSK